MRFSGIRVGSNERQCKGAYEHDYVHNRTWEGMGRYAHALGAKTAGHRQATRETAETSSGDAAKASLANTWPAMKLCNKPRSNISWGERPGGQAIGFDYSPIFTPTHRPKQNNFPSLPAPATMRSTPAWLGEADSCLSGNILGL